MSLQPLSKAAEIYSYPRFLSSSKCQTISLYISDNKIPLNVMGEKIWKGQEGGDIAGNIAEDCVFCASPTPLFLTVLAELWLFSFLSNPLLFYSGGELELVISGLNSPCKWRDFGQTDWEEDSQLWVPTETRLSFYCALCCCSREGKGSRGGLQD